MPAYQICIDGFAACGKSTLARSLADELGFLYIDSGAMYRGMTLYFLKEGLSFDKDPSESVIQNIEIGFDYVPGSEDKLFLNGVDVTPWLRTPRVNENVSKVAALSNVRRRLVVLQQDYGRTKNVVMDGRDIGTVVFPDAILKIFLTADLDTRIQRRLDDVKSRDQKPGYDDVRANLLKRDHIDSTREDSPLIQAKDSVVIDNTNLSKDEQLGMTKLLAEMRLGQNPE